MRALQIKTFGEPGIVLELVDLSEPPAPSAGQVLIGVEHAPINMNDLYLIEGMYPIRPSLPSIVENEGVGRVLAIGRDVDHLKVGDRVLVPLYQAAEKAGEKQTAGRFIAERDSVGVLTSRCACWGRSLGDSGLCLGGVMPDIAPSS